MSVTLNVPPFKSAGRIGRIIYIGANPVEAVANYQEACRQMLRAWKNLNAAYDAMTPFDQRTCLFPEQMKENLSSIPACRPEEPKRG